LLAKIDDGVMLIKSTEQLLSKNYKEQKRISVEHEQSQVYDDAFTRLSHFVHECMARLE